MTITFLQPDGVAITAQQERQGSAAQHGGGSGRPLGGRSGFRVDTAADVLAATSTTWTLKPCSAMIDPGASTHQGMYGWASDADVTGTVTAADATYARKDIVYIQINDSSAGDGSGAKNANVYYLAGTPAASPVAPALPARSFLVGTITVPQAGGGSPTVAVNPARYAAAGADVPVYSLAERDALTKYDGLTVKRMDKARRPVETWDGSAWNLVDYWESSADITTFGTGWTALTGGQKPRMRRVGNIVHLYGGATQNSGGLVTNILTIPTAFRPTETGTTFVGSGVTSGGIAYELVISNGVLSIPSGYLSGNFTIGNAVPVVASWPVD